MADKPPNPQPSGNLANVINDITHKQSAALNGLSDFIGAAADVSGALSTLIPVISLVVSLISGQDDPQTSLVNAINSGFAKLNEKEKATHIIAAINRLGDLISPAETLLKYLNKKGVVTQPDIQKSSTVLTEFSKDGNWLAAFNDQIFWTDAGLHNWPVAELDRLLPIDRGYGEQAPAHDTASGLVFNYIYILPAYAEAVFIFIAVAQSLFPEDFIQQFADTDLRPAAETLQKMHDRILSGITSLSPGQWDRLKLINTLNALGMEVAHGPQSVALLHTTPLADPPSVPSFPISAKLLGGVSIEYGAVEKFSGFSSMADYKITFQEIEGMNETDAYNKFQIRLLKKVKDVYIGVGLLDVWNMINDLRGMVGDSPLPRPNFADWSFRKEIISTAQIRPRQDGFFHVSDIAKFIKRTTPNDTPQQLLTTPLRGLLI
jgi:hypothetical protein